MTATRLLLVSALVGGCIDSDATETETSELAVARQVDAAAGSRILGTSTDHRRVVYGVECDAGDDRTRIKLYDTWTAATTELARGTSCAPGAVFFSPDGTLVAFGDGFGHVQVHDTVLQRTVSVSREGLSTIGVAFSPDSQWFVVASAEDQPLGATLDAWDVDLETHVELAQHAMFNPFAIGPVNVQFSPDSDQLLYLADLAQRPPVGTLKTWSHATGSSHTIASGVAAGGYTVRGDWHFLAYIGNVVLTPPSPLPLQGDLIVRDLVTNQAHTVQASATMMPLAFAGDRLLYGVYESTPQAGFTLKTHDVVSTATATIDTAVFAGYGPNAVALSPDGGRVAYTRNFDPMKFAAELRVAKTSAPPAAKTLSTAAVPISAYGWLDGGHTLAFLHHPTSTLPGATLGTLSAWNADTSKTVQLATAVTQIGLSFDATSSDLLFTSAYDMALAAGDLRAWNTRTGAQRLLDHRVAVISVQRSPEGTTAGYLQVTPDPSGMNPPKTKLRVSRIVGSQRSVTVAANVTSLALGWLGRVIYTGADGVFDALAF